MTIWLRKYRWTLLIVLAVASVVGWEEKRCQTQANQCRAVYTAQLESVVPNEQASEDEAITAACEPNGYFCRLFSAANLPTVLLVLVGIGGIWAALRTLSAIERQAKIIMDKERARISVDAPDNLRLVASKPEAVISYRIQVLAPTKAIIEEAKALAWVTETNDPAVPPISMSIGISAYEVQKDGTLERKAHVLQDIDEALIQEINNSQKFVHFSGFIRYRDVFQPINSKPHETKFNYVWVAVGALGKIAGPPVSSWAKNGDNYET